MIIRECLVFNSNSIVSSPGRNAIARGSIVPFGQNRRAGVVFALSHWQLYGLGQASEGGGAACAAREGTTKHPAVMSSPIQNGRTGGALLPVRMLSIASSDIDPDSALVVLLGNRGLIPHGLFMAITDLQWAKQQAGLSYGLVDK